MYDTWRRSYTCIVVYEIFFISRVQYRSSNFCLSVRHSVRLSTSVTINSSVPMIARIMKPCVVIVLDILYKHAP